MNRRPIQPLTYVRHEERELDKRPLSMDLVRRLAAFTRPYAFRRNMLLLLVTVRSIQLPLLAWAIGAVLGGPVSRMDLQGILWGAAGYGILALSTQLTLRYRAMLALEFGEDVIHDLRARMFAHLQSLSMRYFHKTRIGRTISRFTSDAEAVRSGVQDVLFVGMVQVGQMIVAAILMVSYDAVLFLIIIAMWPVLWAINRYFRKRLSRAYRAVQESFSRVTATLVESVIGIRVTQGFARQDRNAAMFRDLIEDHAEYNMDAARASGVFLPLLEINSQLFVALTLLVGGWRVLNGWAGIEDLYQFILLTAVFFSPIQSLGNQYNNALNSMAGAERIFKLIDTRPDPMQSPGAAPLPIVHGSVRFEHVTFEYDSGRPVLHDIDFSVEPGQTVALVGPTGSGKSSIINLVTRFYLPAAGHVRIDGRDVRDIDAYSLQKAMGIVLQQNFLFTGTVRDNIRIAKPSATDDEIRDTARRLDCLDMLEDLTEGFNTLVGEGGAGVSLGQRQLICFTRAMLADPRIFVLDEATSAVDSITEARIQRSLSVLLTHRTSIVVAHRLSTVRHADIVLVLKDGRIVERGRHEELLFHKGLYARLYRQFIRMAEE